MPSLRRTTCVLSVGLTLLACEPSSSTDTERDASMGAMDAASGANDAGDDAAMPISDAAVDAGEVGCVPSPTPADCVPPVGYALPDELRCTGLYDDFAARTLNCDVLAYEPAYALWSDGSVKRRFVSLPKGAKVDVRDPDAFQYPVGTQFWKEFSIEDSQGGMRLAETRLLRKATEEDWVYTAYVWNEAGTSATQQNDGVSNLFGLGYDVPTRDQCKQCHEGRSDFVLGWDALLLGAGAEGVTLSSLAALDMLDLGTMPLPNLTIPGNAVEQAALGYLHANCGVSCHNSNDAAEAKISGLLLRLDADTLSSVQTTDAITTGINRTPNPNVPLAIQAPPSGAYVDIRPLDLERSLLLARMKLRGDGQMPQIATRVVDQAGVDAISTWILGMTEAAGYPKPTTP